MTQREKHRFAVEVTRVELVAVDVEADSNDAAEAWLKDQIKRGGGVWSQIIAEGASHSADPVVRVPGWREQCSIDDSIGIDGIAEDALVELAVPAGYGATEGDDDDAA